MSLPNPSNPSFSLGKAVKGLVSAPPDLMMVVQAVVQASVAFSPLQSAAGGLLNAIERVQVRLFSPQSYSISMFVGLAEQKAGQNSAELAELSSSLFNLAV